MDTKTIFQVSAVIIAFICIYLTVIHLSMPRLHGLRSVCYGLFSAFVGMMVETLHGRVPDLYSVILANTFLVLINVFLYRGLCELLQAKRRRLLWLVLSSVVPLIFFQLYFFFIHPLISVRIAAYSFIILIQDIFLILLVLRNGHTEMRIPRVSLGILFALSAGLNLLRVYLAFVQQSPSLFPRADAINGVIVLIPIITAVLTAFGFLWLSMSRTQFELELQSRTDALTGLLNRRAIEPSAAREIARSRRTKTPSSVILLDLDGFKGINDHFGHEAGDLALSLTARKLTADLRTTDLIARFGGEEFVIFLPDTTCLVAKEIAERLRFGLSKLAMQHRHREFYLSASFGVTQLTTNDLGWEDMLHRADQALYKAKNQGRNCTVVL
jgi:diguanylate cyclase (GGDEF)-like protein